jgi:hypothetical protein
MKISFDFDSCLGEERMQKLAKKFVEDGHEVWVTTSRLSDEVAPSKHWNRDLKKVVDEVGISILHVQFTNGDDKWKLLKGFDMHFDDDMVEIELIEEHLPEVCGILILDP